MSPYRVAATRADADAEPCFSLAPHEGPFPNCPACDRFAGGSGRICHGKESWWTGKRLCPATPHFHPECITCGHVWLMATRTPVLVSGNGEKK